VSNENQKLAERGRKPDFKLRYLNKRTDERGSVGAAWVNEDTTISIVLNDRVVLRQHPDEILTLFPNDYSSRYVKVEATDAT
jgi:hypothetical protein